MNDLTIRAAVVLEDPDHVVVGCELLADGGSITDRADITISVSELLASSKGSGEYWILTCSCGEPGCAGVIHPIRITHAGPSVVWEEAAMDLPAPRRFVVASDGAATSEATEASDPRTARRWVFDVEEYRSRLAEFVRTLPGWTRDVAQASGKRVEPALDADAKLYGLPSAGDHPTTGRH